MTEPGTADALSGLDVPAIDGRISREIIYRKALLAAALSSNQRGTVLQFADARLVVKR